jgi:hypothetical protein
VVVGEIGAYDYGDNTLDNKDTTDCKDTDKAWFARTAQYLKALAASTDEKVSYFLWSWNSNSRESQLVQEQPQCFHTCTLMKSTWCAGHMVCRASLPSAALWLRLCLECTCNSHLAEIIRHHATVKPQNHANRNNKAAKPCETVSAVLLTADDTKGIVGPQNTWREVQWQKVRMLTKEFELRPWYCSLYPAFCDQITY